MYGPLPTAGLRSIVAQQPPAGTGSSDQLGGILSGQQRKAITTKHSSTRRHSAAMVLRDRSATVKGDVASVLGLQLRPSPQAGTTTELRPVCTN